MRKVLDPGDQARELVRETLRLQRQSIGMRADRRLAGLANAKHEQFFRLLALELAQLGERERRQLTVRVLSFFGALKRMPVFVCSRLSITRRKPRSRSTLRQRKANTSPRRMPVASAGECPRSG